MLTSERLREVLDYDPATGVWTWRVSLGSRAQAGTAACRKGNNGDNGGYTRIRIAGRLYYSHRLAWLYVYGEWPPGLIDHKNGGRPINAIDNLRPATASQNNSNSARLKPGLKGAYWNKRRRRWMSSITINQKQVHLGYFDTDVLAHEAYKAAAIAAFGEFARFA